MYEIMSRVSGLHPPGNGPQIIIEIQVEQLCTHGLLETAFFNVQTIREIKIENKELGGKKNVSSVFTQCVCFWADP